MVAQSPWTGPELLYDAAATMCGCAETLRRVVKVLNGSPQCHCLFAEGPTTQPERRRVDRLNVGVQTELLRVAAEMVTASAQTLRRGVKLLNGRVSEICFHQTTADAMVGDR